MNKTELMLYIAKDRIRTFRLEMIKWFRRYGRGDKTE